MVCSSFKRLKRSLGGQRYRPVRSSHAFTLIELLVVISIMGILAAMLLPSLARAKEQGQSTSCKNRLKQFGLALHMYASDHNHRYPAVGIWWEGPTWYEALEPYYRIGWTNRQSQCPGYRGAIARDAGSYAYNLAGTSVRAGREILPLGLGSPFEPTTESEVVSPATLYAIGDSCYVPQGALGKVDGLPFMFFEDIEYPSRHGKMHNLLCCDGHVESGISRRIFNVTNSASRWNIDNRPHEETW